MIKQTPGKIFLADQRGLTETSQFRRYSTFNFGSYAHEHKQPFGQLYAVNEETLGGTQQLDFTAEQDSHLLLLPVTGALTVGLPSGQGITVEVEEIQLLTVSAGSTIRLSNPYENELITFLHLWIRAEQTGPALTQQQFAFKLSAIENQLTEVVAASQPTQQLPFSVSLGWFAGRQEAVYNLKPGASLFAYVLAGAFEAHGRLLHEKDGLALWETDEVELEALSNNAWVVVIELKA